MAFEKHEDNYEGFFDKHDAFMDELKERCAETKRYELKPDEVSFFSGHIEGNDMILERIVDNKVESFPYPISPENEKVWKSPDIQSIGLFVRFPDGSGNTIVVIEHNLDVIKCADHIIDMGPEGGKAGGTVVVTGTPEEVAMCEKSYTGQFLKPIICED